MISLSILIVDDEQANCENLADILELSGHHATWTTDPQDAIALVNDSPQGHFDFAIIDLKMPGMNGAELLRNLRQTRPFLQAVLVSAYVDANEIDENASKLFEVILSKPVDIESLLKSLEQLVPTVLCVDDDEDFCETLNEVFDSNGIQSLFGHSVQSAQAKLSTGQYNVAVIDLRLPDGNGLAIVDLIQKSNPNIGIIVISGFPNDIDHVTANSEANKVYSVFEKPIDSNELIKRIFEINQSIARDRIENPDH